MAAGYRVSRVLLFPAVRVFVAVASVSSPAPTQVPDNPTPSSTAPVVSPSHPAPANAPIPTDLRSEYVAVALTAVIVVTALGQLVLIRCANTVVPARFGEGSE